MHPLCRSRNSWVKSGWGTRTLNRLVPLVNSELRRLARKQLRSERPGHTMQPTDLIQEAYLRLMRSSQPEWESRTHFFSIAARVMRRILTDHARAGTSRKRDRNVTVTLQHAGNLAPRTSSALIELDDALGPWKVDSARAAPSNCVTSEVCRSKRSGWCSTSPWRRYAATCGWERPGCAASSAHRREASMHDTFRLVSPRRSFSSRC